MSAASQHYRQTYVESRGGKPIRKKKTGIKSRDRPCKPKVVFPVNLDVLEALIPPAHRAKPTAVGDEVIYVPPVAGPLQRWTTATVLRISRHIDTNWIIVAKPNPERSGNPYLAIDSTCVWLAPVNHSFPVTLFPNAGVYVLFCARLQDYYVGESNDVAVRIAGHAKREVVWTRRWDGDFARIEPITLRGRLSYKQHEGRESRALAALHGWDHVRGGGMTSRQSTPRSSQV